MGRLGLQFVCGTALLVMAAVPAPAQLNVDDPLALGAAFREAAKAADREAGALPDDPASDLVLPYASDAVEIEEGPQLFGDGNLKLSAKLVAGNPPLRSGLTWRVFATRPDETGKLPLIATATGGSTSFELDPGNYLVHVAYGRAGATVRVDLGETERLETLVLDAGGLRLNGVSGDQNDTDLEGLTFDIYEKSVKNNEIRRLIAANVAPDNVVPLKAGNYHVVSKYGQVNAVVRADVTVEPDKLTELTAYHKAARLTFRLVTSEGGDALASTLWSILTPGGDTVAESVGAVPQFVLAEGEYVAVAQHNDNVYNRSFSVEAGFNRNVEVVAILAPSELTLRDDGGRAEADEDIEGESGVTIENFAVE